MGIFDKLFSGQGSAVTSLTKREALAAVLLITVASDGHISDDEVRSFGAIINRMKLYAEQSGSEFSSMIDKLMGLLKKQGPVFLLTKAAEALTPELRRTAFALSADLVFADGSVEDEEKELLEQIQAAMQIPDELAVKVIEVLQIKNEG